MPKITEIPIKNYGICAAKIAKESVIVVPPKNATFTKEEWYLNNDMRYKNAVDQQQIAEKILGECERIKDEAEERTKSNKETTDRRLEERIEDIQFSKSELDRQRKEICLELEALDVYKTRLVDCLKSLQENALNQCKKCIVLRERRVGIDLVMDEVDLALRNEINVIFGSQDLLKKTLEQTQEQMRRLRATRYAIDQDLQQKEQSMKIDEEGSKLKHTDLGLAVYEGHYNLDPANITKEEWEKYSAKNMVTAAKEVSTARPLRVVIDALLKQVYEDLSAANSYCNRAFKMRIDETKRAKEKLENALGQTITKVEAMSENIYTLEKALSDKLGYIALAHTRLGKRAQRPGAELVRDAVSNSLKTETEMLKHSQLDLMRVLEEANASLRYLLQTQMQLEEDINVKVNSLMIDEVECMTIRDTMDYHLY